MKIPRRCCVDAAPDDFAVDQYGNKYKVIAVDETHITLYPKGKGATGFWIDWGKYYEPRIHQNN